MLSQNWARHDPSPDPSPITDYNDTGIAPQQCRFAHRGEIAEIAPRERERERAEKQLGTPPLRRNVARKLRRAAATTVPTLRARKKEETRRDLAPLVGRPKPQPVACGHLPI